mgnify:CR=1 FL=1
MPMMMCKMYLRGWQVKTGHHFQLAFFFVPFLGPLSTHTRPSHVRVCTCSPLLYGQENRKLKKRQMVRFLSQSRRVSKGKMNSSLREVDICREQIS